MRNLRLLLFVGLLVASANGAFASVGTFSVMWEKMGSGIYSYNYTVDNTTGDDPVWNFALWGLASDITAESPNTDWDVMYGSGPTQNSGSVDWALNNFDNPVWPGTTQNNFVVYSKYEPGNVNYMVQGLNDGSEDIFNSGPYFGEIMGPVESSKAPELPPSMLIGAVGCIGGLVNQLRKKS